MYKRKSIQFDFFSLDRCNFNNNQCCVLMYCKYDFLINKLSFFLNFLLIHCILNIFSFMFYTF